MDAGLAGFSPGLEVLPAHPSLPAFSFFFYIFVRAACVFRTGETTQESPMLAKKKTIKSFWSRSQRLENDERSLALYGTVPCLD
jgi:hypothetical protein